MCCFAVILFTVSCFVSIGCKEQLSKNWTGESSTAISSNGADSETPITTTKDTTTKDIDSKPASPSAAEETEVATTTRIQFEDVSSKSGVDVLLCSGERRKLHGILEAVGAGISLMDYDLDGLQDIVIPGGADRPREGNVIGFPGSLYRAFEPFRFVSVETVARFDLSNFASQNVAVGDIDNDGFDDVFVSGYGGIQCFLNQGDGTFAKLPPSSGLTDELWSSVSVVADLNGDTFPDLYVARYVNWSPIKNPPCYTRSSVTNPSTPVQSDNQTQISCGPLDFDPIDDRIFFSNGDGTFTDVSTKAGVAQGGRGLAILAADLDDDRDLEIYVANDSDQNFLYRNNANGTLSEIAVRSGVATGKDGISQGSMAISIGDLSGDKKPDLFICNFMNELPAIYISRGRLNFRFSTGERGIDLLGKEQVSWGSSIMDFDNDGDEDVIVVSGNVDNDETKNSYYQTASLLENVGNGMLRDNSKIAGGFFVQAKPARGLATTDFDGDGKMDFVTSNLDLPIGILKNASQDECHWLQIKTIGVKSARNPIGTVIELRSGDKCWVRQVVSGGSFSSSSDFTVHVGVGKEASLPALLTLRWPSGITDEMQIDHWDQRLTIVESTR